jgi:AAA+ ATPase superfamily predicted ATPase
MDFIIEVSARYRKEHGGIQPVYVLQVEGDRTNPEELVSLAKELGHFMKKISNTDTALMIADISTRALASGMTTDRCAKIVNIPDLKTEKALHLLQLYAQELQEDGMLTKDIVDQIGGHPAWLIYVGNSSSPQVEIDRLLSEARDDVKVLLACAPGVHGTAPANGAKGL